MDAAIAAALTATAGFAVGDVFTALLARKVNGQASMALLSLLKLVLYLPFALLAWQEFRHIDGYVFAWSAVLGVIFFMAYWGFNMGMEKGKDPALVGVVAGCFPASAAVVAIVFLGQRPSAWTLILLAAVLTGVVLIGMPERWHKSSIDKGVALALIPMVCWGVFGALLHEPVNHLGTAHGWFVVQMLVAGVLVLGSALLYNRGLPAMVRETSAKRAWLLVLLAGAAIGMGEALQALSLGTGKNLIIVEALLGAYPAAYFLIAHKVFKEPLRTRQWVGIVLVAVCIVLLSTGSTT